VQVQGLRWSDEAGIGRHGVLYFRVVPSLATDGGLGPVTALTDSSVLAEPDLGSIFEVPAGLILVSSRPREPIEKPWMCVP
jgi:hypothetical protein